MLISKIEVQKKNKYRCNVFVDGEFSFSLSANSIVKEHLAENQSISEDDINRYKALCNNEKAYSYILFYLQYGDRSEKEVRTKLREKGYPQQSIDSAVAHAKDINLINDKHLCDQYVYEKLTSNKPDGPHKIKSKLIQRGLNIGIIEEAISKYLLNENEKSKIRLLVQKKLPSIKAKNTYEMRGKLFRFIAQRGFNFDDINSVLDDVFSDDDFLASLTIEESE